MEKSILHFFSLNYKDKEYEKAFKDHVKIYTLKMLDLFYIYISLALLVAFCKNIYLNNNFYVLRTLILGIFLVMALLIIKDYGKKNQKNIEIGFCCLIIFIYAIHLWYFFPPLDSLFSKHYHFYLGYAIESVRVFLFISKIRWYFIWTSNMIINMLIYQNSIYNQEFDDKANLFSLLFPIIMVNTLPIITYFQEKNYRLFFYQNINYDKTLKSFEALINRVLPNQIIILNESRSKIIFCNEEVLKFYNSNDYDFIYQKVKTIYIQDENSYCLLSSINKSQFEKGKHFLDFQSSIKRNDSYEEFYFDIKIGKIHWQSKEVYLMLLSDISAVKLVSKLKELDAYKDRLLATVSHDLRTPLNGLNGILELLSARLFEKDLLKYLKIATRCSSLLMFMINDILDFSQISNGKLRLNLIKYKISQLIKEVSYMLKFQFKKKNIHLNIDIQPELKNQSLICDYRRVQQVLLNLISNSLKFTNEGYIKISVRKKCLSYEKFMVEFSVEDTGIGIKEIDIPKLFQLFGKLDLENPSINRSGIGLGLVISKHLVELMSNNPNATITVKSEYGKGSVFFFELPFNIAEEDDVNEEFFEKEEKVNDNLKEYKNKVNSPNLKSVNSSSSIHSSNIYGSPIMSVNLLVVDDDQIGLFIIGKYLESFGIKYKTASDGKKAIDTVLKEKNFNLVLMDCNMPIINGFEASRKIIDLVHKKKIPPLHILALTANTSNKDIDECKESGMEGFLAKPVSKQHLKEKIQEILKIKIHENNHKNSMKEKFINILPTKN